MFELNVLVRRLLAVSALLACTICLGLAGCNDGSDNLEPGPSDLQASVVHSYLQMPANGAMGGFGDRVDDFPGAQTDPRVVDFFFNARGMMQRLSLKALLLENGLRRVIMLRLPLIYSTDLLRDTIIENVAAETGEDIRYELFLGATHSHHAPARWYETPDPFGQVGMDSFQQAMFIQLTDELTRLTLEVMAAERVPVTFSFGANDNFDPEDRVNEDRRQEDDNLYFHQNGILCAPADAACQAVAEPVTKDPRLHIVRLDRIDGSPFAIIANLPVHGTAMGGSNQYMTEDAPGLIEAKTEELFVTEGLGEVTVMLMQGTAGNVAPGRSDAGHDETQRMEALGITAAGHIAELYQSLPAGKTRIDIEYFPKRFPISRDLIGYTDDEFVNGDFVYTRGALLCSENYDADDGVPETKMALNEIDCLVDLATVEGLLGPITMFDQTTVSVMRLGELYIIGLPGEATTPLGMEIHRRMSERYGIGRENSVIYAYANAHQFYLLLEDDWLQGGYEAGFNIWGPRLGNYLSDVLEDLIEPATTPELEDPLDYDEIPQLEQVDWANLRRNDVAFDVYATPSAGNPLSQPEDVQRLEIVEFTWEGGDPMIDLPHVWLEVDDGIGGFVPVTRADGTVMSDKGYELWLLHVQDGQQSEWTARYEFMAYEPEATYRFAYWGRLLMQPGGGTEMYGSAESPLYSAAFSLSRRTSLAFIDAEATGTTVTATLGYPLVEGAYRLRNMDYPESAPDPLLGGEATVTVSIGGQEQAFEEVPVAADGTLTVELGSAVLPGQLLVLTIEVVDSYGNDNSALPFVENVTAQQDRRYDDDPAFSADVIYGSPVGPGPRGFLDVRGLIHEHSPHSHDACDEEPKDEDGNFDAQCLLDFHDGLCSSRHDFVMLTDHPTHFFEVPFPETLLYEAGRGDELVMHNGRPVANRAACEDGHRALILAGSEGGFMPVGLEAHVAEVSAYNTLDEDSEAEIEELGGVVLLSHTENYTAESLATLPIAGFEMYNLHANLTDAIDDGTAAQQLGEVLNNPDDALHPDLVLLPILREDPVYLKTWAGALALGARRVTTMGTDAHRNSLNIPLADGERIDSWRRMNRWFSNHLLLGAHEDNEWDDRDLKQALEAGRLYGVFELLGYARDFDFHAVAGEQMVEMGGSASLAAGITLHLALPSVRGLEDIAQPPRTLRLLRATMDDGWQEVAQGDNALAVTIDMPGAYRAEVRMRPEHLRPVLRSFSDLAEADFVWIYSNAIYVTD